MKNRNRIEILSKKVQNIYSRDPFKWNARYLEVNKNKHRLSMFRAYINDDKEKLFELISEYSFGHVDANIKLCAKEMSTLILNDHQEMVTMDYIEKYVPIQHAISGEKFATLPSKSILHDFVQDHMDHFIGRGIILKTTVYYENVSFKSPLNFYHYNISIIDLDKMRQFFMSREVDTIISEDERGLHDGDIVGILYDIDRLIADDEKRKESVNDTATR